MVNEPQSKVYIETIKQIQNIIANDQLTTGDKIPSERELADRLNFGRSSVREALRALELLGLIETRRGEGTFVKDFGGHHLVELIGGFILQTGRAKDDLVETKRVIEEQAITLAMARITTEHIKKLRILIECAPEHCDKEFMKSIFLATNNRLLLKIWLLLSEYYIASLPLENKLDLEIYENLLSAFEEKNLNLAFQQIQKMYE
ncbi:FadR/GntR family transcriptional regulator [Bacillus suaedaesalsae]|uniref:FadR/GntR family transcriptional regulator n=1 Tax=Bacillus suaedaesalsae TaxID=2810349 RepID=UPI003211AFC4